jgi:TonB family protein
VSRLYRTFLLSLGGLFFVICAAANDLSDAEQKLRGALKGNIVTLRKFYSGSKLRYTPDGALKNQAEVCPWTVCSKISISDVKVDKDRLLIRAERLIVYFEGEPLVVKYSHAGQSLEIEVAPVSTADELTHAVSRVFVSPGTRLSDLVPDYWEPIVCRVEQGQPIVQKATAAKPGDPIPESKDVFSVGGSVSPPRLKKAPDPEYPPLAKGLRREGMVLLWGVVREDGKIHDVRVARPVGLGFEEQAVKAVESWEFEPGQKEGRPVAVQLNIEVNFRFR